MTRQTVAQKLFVLTDLCVTQNQFNRAHLLPLSHTSKNSEFKPTISEKCLRISPISRSCWMSCRKCPVSVRSFCSAQRGVDDDAPAMLKVAVHILHHKRHLPEDTTHSDINIWTQSKVLRWKRTCKERNWTAHWNNVATHRKSFRKLMMVCDTKQLSPNRGIFEDLSQRGWMVFRGFVHELTTDASDIHHSIVTRVDGG